MTITTFSFQTSLYSKLLGALIKKGQKLKAKKIIDNAFAQVAFKLKIPFNRLILKLFITLNTFVETKTLLLKRRLYTIPFSINLKRRIHLVLKWLLKAILENNKKISFSEKLAIELYAILQSKRSKAVKYKTLNNKQAILNRSNIHYRW